MIKDVKVWRMNVAKELGTTVNNVKKGVSAILFGMSSKKWRRLHNIPDKLRSPHFDRFEKEVKEARTLISLDEIDAGRASIGDRPTRVLSRAVERIEEQIMSSLISHLKGEGWATSSLIHDEIVIRPSTRFGNPNIEMQSLDIQTKLNFRAFEDSRGWQTGTLQIKIQHL